jgi:phosphoribosylamine--glycine ligase / phosphoribosylformylglycinamidine cyclo-ligase
LKILVVGSGGREHAIAWKLSLSPRSKHLWIAPGNPGTAQIGDNIPISANNVPALVDFARENQVELVVIGSETSLAVGLSDALASTGIAVFGPSQAAAQIETSKSFAKQFMQRHGIPTGRFAVFKQFELALKYLDGLDYPVVIKASGLAAGKGVVLPGGKDEARRVLHAILVEDQFGQAGEEVIIEERLEGEEVSLLAFTDGRAISVMPPAQDHKRLLDGDGGPNTGGMGAYAPAQIYPSEMQTRLLNEVLRPAVDGLRAEGMPFAGVLYAGLIFTRDGPQVLEFNARFGDPETQVILPLLETDLLEICDACAHGELSGVPVRWKNRSAVCVVMASAGYPETSSLPTPVYGLDDLPNGSLVFHAGTGIKEGQILAIGGRVLGITCIGEELPQAVSAAYATVAHINFLGAQYRKDIAHKALGVPVSLYQGAGVNIDAGNRAVDLMRAAVSSTYDRRVLAGIGAFGGLFDAGELKGMRSPVLVASTDGVGTKVKLAASLGRYRGIGLDIVNHCINDILVQGARPLFFLDYFATSRLQPEVVAEIVSGISEACRLAGCVLIGGETAEMPGVYLEGEFDLAGTIVGCLERDHMLPKGDIHPGDRLIGIQSTGPHTNGFSLLSKIFDPAELNCVLPELGGSLADALLVPHRSYLGLLLPLIEASSAVIKGLAHITGGSFIENIPRILPEGMGACIHKGSWPVPAIFQLAQRRGQISEEEIYRIFNMGIGMVVVVGAQDVPVLQSAIPEQTWVIGEVVEDWQHKVKMV